MAAAIESPSSPDVSSLAREIVLRAEGSARCLVAIAGPPAAGKSTLAEALADRLDRDGQRCAVVGMDGFHYDDAVLAERGLSHRKGAPETFDFPGLETLLKRLKAGDGEVAVPVFYRSLELSRAAGAIVPAKARIVIVEGNYLLLDQAPWRGLSALFDITIFLDVARAELERRLVARWRMHGREEAAARHWIDTNDLPNVDLVMARRLPADLVA